MIKELSEKKLLVLGGNPYSDIIHSFAVENGIKVYSMSNDPNASIHVGSFKSFVHSSTDIEELKRIIRDEEIDGVYLGGNESVISAVCQTVNELGLPCYCTKQQWDLFQNKSIFKSVCKSFGLPVLERYDYKIEKECDVDFPVITKPVDGCGSCGFSVCHNYEELRKGYLIAKDNSSSGEVIVEKFVKNEGHVVFYSFSNGKPVFNLLQDKYPFKFRAEGSFVAGIQIYKSLYTKEFIDKFDKKLSLMFETIGIKEGTLWIEVFHDGDKYYFNEAGFRYGGSITIYPIDYFTGINQVASDIYYCLTGKSKLYGFDSMIRDTTLKNRRYYCQYPIYVNRGTIANISGFDLISADKRIVKVIVKKRVGVDVEDTGDFSQNFAYIHFVFDSRNEFYEIIEMIDNSISVLDVNHIEMIIRHEKTFFEKVRL